MIKNDRSHPRYAELYAAWRAQIHNPDAIIQFGCYIRSVLAKEDDGTYEAFYFGKSSIQTEAESERASFYAKGEDCLTLNIWSDSSEDADGKTVDFVAIDKIK